MTSETYKPVVGFEGLYEVSDLGNVKSLEREEISYSRGGNAFTRKRNERILKARSDIHGYQIVALCKDGKTYDKKIHRLVAEAFIPNPSGLPIINHKDENPSNNKLTNLEWCTNQYNQLYGTCPIRKGASVRNTKNKTH